MKKIFLLLWNVLFGDEKLFVTARSLAAFVLAGLFAAVPSAADDVLLWMLWAIFGLSVLAFAIGGLQSKKRSRTYWAIAAAILILWGIVLIFVPNYSLERFAAAVWAAVAGAGLWMNGLRSYNSVREQLLRFGEGLVCFVVGAFFLLKFQRPVEDYRWLFVIFFTALGALNLGSANWFGKKVK